MNAIVEMDKAGRLVVPKNMGDALHLRPGDQLAIVLEGDKLVLVAERGARGLYRDSGWLVFDSGVRMTENEALRQIEDDRNSRIAYLSGEREA